MANQGLPFQMDSFGQIQANPSQRLQPEQSLRGVPPGLGSSWSDMQDQYRQQNPAMHTQQPSAAHQMNQSHQGIQNPMNMVTGRDINPQLHHRTPRPAHTVIGAQSQYPQLGPQQQPQFSHANMNQSSAQNININQNPNAQNSAHLMPLSQQPRSTPTTLPFSSTPNYNPALVRQFQNLNTGIANGPSQVQRPSFTNPSPVSQAAHPAVAELQQHNNILNAMEHQCRQAQAEIRSLVDASNIQGLQTLQERLMNLRGRFREGHEKLNRFLGEQAWPQESLERILAQANTLKQRYIECTQSFDRLINAIETTVHNLQNNMAPNSRSSINGPLAQPWPPTQGSNSNVPQPGQGQPPNSMNSSTSTLNSSFPNSNSARPNSVNAAMMDNRANSVASQSIGGETDSIKTNFLRIIAGAGIPGSAFVTGHLIDFYQLFTLIRKFSPQQQSDLTAFRIVGVQLGLPPTETNPPRASAQAAMALKEYYEKIAVYLERTKAGRAPNQVHPSQQLNSNLPNNPVNMTNSIHSSLPSGSQSFVSPNAAIFNHYNQRFPQVDWSIVTAEMINNLPTQRLEQILKNRAMQHFSLPNAAVAMSAMGVGPQGVGQGPNSAPARPNSAMTHGREQRGPTPAIPGQEPQHQPQQHQQHQQHQVQQSAHLSGQHRSIMIMEQNVLEIRALHAKIVNMWKNMFTSIKADPVAPPPPSNVQPFKEKLSHSLQVIKRLLPAFGLFLWSRKDDEETKQIARMSVMAIKQMIALQTIPVRYILTSDYVNKIFVTIVPLVTTFFAQLSSARIPPELQSMIHPSDADMKSLFGFLPDRTQQQMPQTQTMPNPPMMPQSGMPMQSVQHGSGSHQTPIATYTPGSTTMPTPISHPTPTPSHHSAQPVGASSTIGNMRRGGFSEGNMSSPHNHTPPASSLPTQTPPAAASPPKARVSRQRTAAPKRKPSKTANTPSQGQTPGPDPGSTPATAPTPAPSSGTKRPHEEAETLSNHPEPPHKRAKTETPQPPPPQPPQLVSASAPTAAKAPTPPSQLAPPIDKSQIKTEEDAKNILEEAFNRAEQAGPTPTGGDNTLSGATQNPSDLLQWLTSVMSNPSALVEPEVSTSTLPAPNGEGDMPVLPDGGAEEEDLFNFAMYYGEAEAAPSSLPELEDKHGTLSPESHNGALTTTPPSQGAPRAGASTSVATTLKGVGATSKNVDTIEPDFLSFSDPTFTHSAFSYSEPLEEPWAIAQG